MPPPLNENERIDEAFAAYLRLCDSGELKSREEFLQQFPDLAEQLRQLMDAADMIGSVTMAGFDVEGGSSGNHHDVKANNEMPILGSDSKGSQEQSNPGGAETIQTSVGHSNAGQGDPGHDPAMTLPMANRPKGDNGPTLPYDLGEYELQQVIGKGGMGIVYLARQKQLDRMVAVKMIRGGMLADESDVRRFNTEAQAAARLHHPGIVPVHQFGKHKEHHFFSMSYVAGTDLQRKINSDSIEPKVAARYVRDVARAIEHAHQKGVLHRDLKPANVLIDHQDKVHVTDFGLAKHIDADSSVTGTGAAVGTPHYMAPEQADGHSDRACVRSDVYSLGAVLFACLAGRPPLIADSVMETLMQVVHQPAPPVRVFRGDAPIDLETIIAKCLEKDPNKRYQSASNLADDLDAFLEDRPIRARPRAIPVKMLQWLGGVPLVGALSGRRVLDSSVSHRRFQAALLLLLLLSPFVAAGLLVVWNDYRDTMPSQIMIAGGLDDGVYNEVSSKLGQRFEGSYPVSVTIESSNGSLDNRDRLLRGDVHIAPMQASAISGDDLCVVAPLFYEAVHLLAKFESSIRVPADLRGRRVAVGPIGSGSRATAEMVFDSLSLDGQATPRVVLPWRDISESESPSAALICIGRGSPLVARLLTSGNWRLISIPMPVQVSLQHPTLRPMTITAEDYPDAVLPVEGIATVGTTAFLACRIDAPSELVESALRVLYQRPALFKGLIPRRQAAEWQGLALHRAARRFYVKQQ